MIMTDQKQQKSFEKKIQTEKNFKGNRSLKCLNRTEFNAYN